MSIQHSTEKILAFRPSRTPSPRKRPKLHPAVRRRRLLWLIAMVAITGWAIIQFTVQQFQIWNKEEQLAIKSAELKVLEQRSKELEKAVYQLKHDEAYLNELAHEKGYSKPGEEIYWIKEKD